MVNKVIKLFNEYEVDNIDEIIKKLEMCHFFDKPASLKFHGKEDGDLARHSIKVTECLLDLTKGLNLTWEKKRSPVIVGIFHDLVKVENYKENGKKWEMDHSLIYDGIHGLRSLMIAEKLIPDLTKEEAACIRWHMGAYEGQSIWNALGNAIERYPNVLYTHTADMMASKIYGI